MKSFRQDARALREELKTRIIEAAFIAYQKDEHALDGAPDGLRDIVLHLSNDRDQLENFEGCGDCDMCKAVEAARAKLPKSDKLQ